MQSSGGELLRVVAQHRNLEGLLSKNKEEDVERVCRSHAAHLNVLGKKTTSQTITASHAQHFSSTTSYLQSSKY